MDALAIYLNSFDPHEHDPMDFETTIDHYLDAVGDVEAAKAQLESFTGFAVGRNDTPRQWRNGLTNSPNSPKPPTAIVSISEWAAFQDQLNQYIDEGCKLIGYWKAHESLADEIRERLRDMLPLRVWVKRGDKAVSLREDSCIIISDWEAVRPKEAGEVF